MTAASTVAVEMASDRTAEQGIMGAVAQPSRTLVGRDAELTEIDALLGVRSSSGGRAAGARAANATTSSSPVTPGSARPGC